LKSLGELMQATARVRRRAPKSASAIKDLLARLEDRPSPTSQPEPTPDPLQVQEDFDAAATQVVQQLRALGDVLAGVQDSSSAREACSHVVSRKFGLRLAFNRSRAAYLKFTDEQKAAASERFRQLAAPADPAQLFGRVADEIKRVDDERYDHLLCDEVKEFRNAILTSWPPYIDGSIKGAFREKLQNIDSPVRRAR
jgi:hypothetical protein